MSQFTDIETKQYRGCGFMTISKYNNKGDIIYIGDKESKRITAINTINYNIIGTFDYHNGVIWSLDLSFDDNINLFSSDIDKIASKISAKKYLRDQLRVYQREFPKKYANRKKYAIVEGRDIGTEIFPEAKFKVFLWADPLIRAKRRYEQVTQNGKKIGLKQIYNEIIARDSKDLGRKIAPLRPAANSVLLDTSYLDIEQAFNAIKKILNQKSI